MGLNTTRPGRVARYRFMSPGRYNCDSMASATPPAAPGERLRALWERLAPLPGGKHLFSWLLGRMVPYTASIRPRVVELLPGYAKVRMADRRAVRNHLSSVHAVALANLAEVTSGLALVFGLPPDARSIPTALSITFLKKARGLLTAEARCEPPLQAVAADYDLQSVIKDAAGDVVARATVRWRIGPRT
jgi:acyl-coenzyme A thioesterase PaaI-like protein